MRGTAMIRRFRSQLRRYVLVLATAFVTLLGTASPASAQQLIDASKDGDLAFAAFAFMCILFAGLLFAIDWVRKRGEENEADK